MLNSVDINDLIDALIKSGELCQYRSQKKINKDICFSVEYTSKFYIFYQTQLLSVLFLLLLILPYRKIMLKESAFNEIWN